MGFHIINLDDNSTAVLGGSAKTVTFTLTNKSKSDFKVKEIELHNESIISHNATLPITLKGNQSPNETTNIVFTINLNSKEDLPFNAYVTTTEYGETIHTIRFTSEPTQTENHSSNLEIVGGYINIGDRVYDTQTNSISFDVKNTGIGEHLRINSIKFLDGNNFSDENLYDFITYTKVDVNNSVDASGGYVQNGHQIAKGSTATLSFNLDLRNSPNPGLFATNVLPNPPDSPDLYSDGLDVYHKLHVLIDTNSKFSSYGLNTGEFRIPLVGKIHPSGFIQIISNDKSRRNPIEFLHLIEKTNRRSEELIIKNTGNSTLKITDISSNYKALNSSNANVDVLSFYDGSTLTNYTSGSPLEITSGNQKTLTIYFDDIRFPDTNGDGTIDEKDDDNIYITHNREFTKTITLTTDSTNGSINADSNNKYEIFVPFSIYPNLYESNYPSSYEWKIAEVFNEFGQVDSSNNPTNSSYAKPYGHILDTPLIPSRVHVAQLRVRNDSSSSKKFQFEIVETSREWTQKPYISLGRIAPDASKEEIVLEISSNTTSGSLDTTITNTSFTDRLLVLSAKTNNEKELGSFNETANKFDEKYDLKKDGECIVVKITEGTEDSNGCFIPSTETQSFNSGNDIITKEKSVVTYVVGSWKGRTREFFTNTYFKEETNSLDIPEESTFHSNSYTYVNESIKFWISSVVGINQFYSNTYYYPTTNSFYQHSSISDFFVNSYYYPETFSNISFSSQEHNIYYFWANSYYQDSIPSGSSIEQYIVKRDVNGDIETSEKTFYTSGYMVHDSEHIESTRTVRGADPDPPTPDISQFFTNGYMESSMETSYPESKSMFYTNSYYGFNKEEMQTLITDASFSTISQFFTNSYYQQSSENMNHSIPAESIFYTNSYADQGSDSSLNTTVDIVSIIEYTFHTNSYMDVPKYPTQFENWEITTYT